MDGNWEFNPTGEKLQEMAPARHNSGGEKLEILKDSGAWAHLQ